MAEWHDAITGNTGGYIVTVMNGSGQPQEFLIMDDPDIANATKVWRWNVNGLGYSSTGYAGPYTTAITQSGEIVADFITTGTLNAALVNVINLIAEHVQAVDGSKTMDIDAAQLKVNNGANWRAWLRTDNADQGTMFVYGGKRTNLNGQAVDPGNDSTSSLSYIDPHGIAVGLDNTDTPTGNIRAGYEDLYGDLGIHKGGEITIYDSNGTLRHWIQNDGDWIAYDASGKTRISISTSGDAYNGDANGNYRWYLTDSGNLFLRDSTPRTRIRLDGTDGNVRSYDSTGQERVGLYPAEGQISLYNSSGTRTVQIRGDGTASTAPLPISQGGIGANNAADGRANFGLDFERRISAGSSETLTIGTTTRFLLFASGGATNAKAMWLVASTSSGSVSVGQIYNGGTALTLSTATNSLTVSNGSSVTIALGIIVLGGTVS